LEAPKPILDYTSARGLELKYYATLPHHSRDSSSVGSIASQLSHEASLCRPEHLPHLDVPSQLIPVHYRTPSFEPSYPSTRNSSFASDIKHTPKTHPSRLNFNAINRYSQEVEGEIELANLEANYNPITHLDSPLSGESGQGLPLLERKLAASFGSFSGSSPEVSVSNYPEAGSSSSAPTPHAPFSDYTPRSLINEPGEAPAEPGSGGVDHGEEEEMYVQ